MIPVAPRRHKPVVYYVTGKDLGVLKIGTTINMGARFKRMKYTSPGAGVPILMGWEYGGEGLENRRHAQFSGSKVRSDWFAIDDALKSHLSRIRKGDELPDEEES